MEDGTIKGKVVYIKKPHNKLNIVTLNLLSGENWKKIDYPIYMDLNMDYIGKDVKIINSSKGFLGRLCQQSIEAEDSPEDLSDKVTISHRSIKKIIYNYEKQKTYREVNRLRCEEFRAFRRTFGL